MLKERFVCDKTHIPNQQGNYKETLRVNDDTLNRLGWEPKKDLREYILNLN